MGNPVPQVIRLGTRGSKLALAQSGQIAERIRTELGVQCELVIIKSEGDILTGSLANLGGTGVFVTRLRDAVLSGEVDLAVHSLKDIPTAAAPGLQIAAIPEREDPRDALCSRDSLNLQQLPAGAVVGTGSPRRVAQIKASRPDVHTKDIRGNVDTRLGKIHSELDAVVLACAGLLRLGREGAITEALDPQLMLPAPGQGALALETLPETELARLLAGLDHLPTRLAVTAERALLARLEAGCAAPVGALAVLDESGTYAFLRWQRP